MFGAINGIIVLSLMVANSINQIACQSPCPNFFRYVMDETTGEIIGRIEIPDAPNNVALQLRVSLSVATKLPTKYLGRLELATSRSEAMKAVQQGRSLIYRLYFPLRQPIPLLTEILFNGQRYCMGRRAMGPIVTTIFLEHSFYPSGLPIIVDNKLPSTPANSSNNLGNLDMSQDPNTSRPTSRPNLNFYHPAVSTSDEHKDDTPFIPTPIPIPIQDIRQRNPGFNPTNPFLRPTSNAIEENCGRVFTEDVTLLIANGESTKAGQWPWLVAIFIAKKDFEYQCAGSLVSDRHVLTVAHCKFKNDVELPQSAFLVSVGRYHLRQWREKGSKNIEVREYIVHPEYRNRYNADADIAIIKLREKVTFTPRIQPLCLWNGLMSLESVVGRNGNVVGWGKDESGNQRLSEPRMVEMPIVSQEDCLRSNIAFLSSTSNRTFCAGSRNGSGPCNGDSGSGLVLRDPITGRYHLRGIISLSLLDKSTLSCDLKEYLVFVDVPKFQSWIKTQMKV